MNVPEEHGESLSAFLAGRIHSTYAGRRLQEEMEDPDVVNASDDVHAYADDSDDPCRQSANTDGNCTQCCEVATVHGPCLTHKPDCSQQGGDCEGPAKDAPKHPHQHPHKHASWYDRA
jgi:hypothetical protein